MNYELPRKYWEERDPQGKKVEEEKLIGIIEEFIGKHNVMGLATACGETVRNTPVEYDYWVDGIPASLSEEMRPMAQRVVPY